MMKNRTLKSLLACTLLTLCTICTPVMASEAAGSDVTKLFSDVRSGAWYTDYIQYAYDHQLMTGIAGTDLFQPDTQISKAQVAQVLYNKEGKPKVTDQTVFSKLKDVSAAAWYADAVAWAYGNGIITGDISTMTFSPNASVTREQLALMMYRYSDFKGYSVGKTASLSKLENADKVSSWAKTSVKWAVGTTLISGLKTDTGYDLAPQGTATRAQMSAILERYNEDYLPNATQPDNNVPATDDRDQDRWELPDIPLN